MNRQLVLDSAIAVALLAPAITALSLGLASALGRRAREPFVNAISLVGAHLAALAGLVASTAYAVGGTGPQLVPLPSWFGAGDYHFEIVLRVDGVSLTFLALSGVISAMVVQMAVRYLHREAGHRRFFGLLGLGQVGIGLIALADSLDLLFVGWELVGIASALLIGFYSSRSSAARHGLLAFGIYRACDVGLLSAVVLLHHASGHGVLPLDGAQSALSTGSATLLGFLLLFGAMGKSAQFPLTGYLPRAMEGPSPSSAVFYGGLSVHAGAYLLLRTAPLFEHVALVRYAIVAVGLMTALHATVVGRAQTDAKSQLAYATVQQVGLIFVEVGLGFYTLALAHLVGNALLRSAQLLRAASMVEDHVLLEADLGAPRVRPGVKLIEMLPASVQRGVYHYALERGHIDVVAARLATALGEGLAALDALDRRLLALSAFGVPRPASEAQGEPARTNGEVSS